jgi:16S rRNA (uracil1498-N3)-methyltransferase
MRLTRVYVDAVLTDGAVVELPKETGAHLAKVLRARSGDQIILFSGDGREHLGAVERVLGPRVTVSIGGGRPVDRESPLALTLVQSVPRGDRMDVIVQKATELGVARIVPVLSRRSVVRLAAEQAEAKAAHWRAVVVNACEQCGRNRIPDVDVPVPLIHYLGAAPARGTRMVLEPDPGAAPSTPGIGDCAEVAIGPEGGFDDEELDALRIAGFVRIRLGPRILRTETAAIAALTWLQTRFGDMRVNPA